ncbi:hypothetical protein KJ564_15165 [bacterium]|nr:hypothetical protein [bacterium]
MTQKHLISLKASVLLVSAVLLFSGCTEENSNNPNGGTLRPADLLPASNEISGWEKGTDTGDYGEADDQASLYALINGYSELYIQHGFVEGVFQVYDGIIGFAVEAEIYIGDHGSQSNAAELFDEEQVVPNSLTPWEVVDEAMIDETLPFHVMIHARADRFYIRVQVEKGNDDTIAQVTAQQFVTAIINEIN